MLSGGTAIAPLFELLANGWHMVSADWVAYNTPISTGMMGPWRANGSVARAWCAAQMRRIEADKHALGRLEWGAMNAGLNVSDVWFANRSYAAGSVAPDGTRLFVMPGESAITAWEMM